MKNYNLKIKKKLTFIKKNTHGINNRGKITVRHLGGGHKGRIRYVDNAYGIYNMSFVVLKIEKDPFRSGKIALVLYKNGIFSYILVSDKIKEGDILIMGSSDEIVLSNGNAVPLRFLSSGLSVFNVELKVGFGGKLGRAAGSFLLVLGSYIINNKIKILVKLKSGDEYMLNGNCLGTVGVVSNINHMYRIYGKAGYSRWLNIRPHVRGVAMNPVDHPHGGGEGKTSGGRCSVSYKGKLTKGKKTRKRKINYSIIIKRKNV